MLLSAIKNLVIARLQRGYDLQAMVQLAQFDLGYIPWTGSAMRPGGLRLAVNEVIIHQRVKGIEFGAGISTLYLAKAFLRAGGHLTTVDHDEGWLKHVQGELDRLQIPKAVCKLVCSPLVQTGDGRGAPGWYDREVLERATAEERYDFALVDGPVSTKANPGCREPVRAFLGGRLCESYSVVVDDIDRAKDRDMATAWASELRADVTMFKAQGGVAVIRPAPGPWYNIC
jgi:hypothetical protein